jgi:hypothetical protein
MTDPYALLDEYKEQRIRAEQTEAVAKYEKKKLEAIKYKLVDILVERKLPRVCDEHLTFSKKRDCGFRLNEENTDQVRDWLVQETGDDMPFVEEKVSRRALKEYIEDRVLQDGWEAEDFPTFLGVSLHPNASVAGWKRFKQEQEQE